MSAGLTFVKKIWLLSLITVAVSSASAAEKDLLDKKQLKLAADLLTDSLACAALSEEDSYIVSRTAAFNKFKLTVTTHDSNNKVTATFKLSDIIQKDNDAPFGMVLLCKSGECISETRICASNDSPCSLWKLRKTGQRYLFCSKEARENARFALDLLFKHQNEILARSR